MTLKEEVESFTTKTEKLDHIRLIRNRTLRLKADPKTVECLSKGVELSDEWKKYIQENGIYKICLVGVNLLNSIN